MRKVSLSFDEQVKLWKSIQPKIQSEWYSDRFSIIDYIQSQGHKIIEEMRLKYCPREEILDLGCGIGIHTKFIKGEFRYTGLDISPEHLSRAPKKDNLTFIKGDIYNLPFEDNSWPAALSLYLLEHLFNLEAAISKIKRILAPGGIFLAAIPNEGGWFWNFGRQLSTKRYIEKRHPELDYLRIIREYEHPNSVFKIKVLLTKEFKVLEIKQYPFNFLPAHLNLLTIFALRK